jgi:hypothetical protein
MFFNVFEAAPENERDGPTQQAAQNVGGKVSAMPLRNVLLVLTKCGTVARVFLIVFLLIRRCSKI